MIQTYAPLRCSYCHGEARGLLQSCAGCASLLHVDCRRELGRCTTLGCQRAPALRVSLRAPPRERRPLGAWLRGLARSRVPLIGWALITLVVMVLVLGLWRPSSPESRRVVHMHAQAVKSACVMFRADHKRYPSSLDELTGGDTPYLRPRRVPHGFHFVTLGRTVCLAQTLEPGELQPEIRVLISLYDLD